MTFMKCEKCGAEIEVIETSYCEGCQEEEENCKCPRIEMAKPE